MKINLKLFKAIKLFRKSNFISAIFLAAMLICNVAFADYEETRFLDIDLRSSHRIKLDEKITRLAIGDPEVATVVQIPGMPDEFLIITHGVGSTALFVWTVTNNTYKYMINVSPEDSEQAKMIQRAIGLPDVHVKKVGDKVLLTGSVRNQYERNYAVQVARLYVDKGSESSLSVGSGISISVETQEADKDNTAGHTVGGSTVQSKGEIIDLLHMRHPTQVRLEAQVIAINPQDRSNIGIQYGDDPLSSPGVFTLENNRTSGNYFRHGAWEYSPLGVRISALVTQDRAKILSRPSITTMSGEEAVIQVGGEIPYTTRDKDGWVNVTFKNYGIILQLKPTVDAEDRITSTIHTEVSNVSGETVGDLPILGVRRADAVVTVRSGSTMVIGGLLDSSERKVVSKFPLLGNIPIIGEFFKYTSKTKDKQELIILVTPYIVEDDELSQAQMSDSMKDFYDKGRAEKDNLNKVDLNDLPEDNDKPVAFAE